MQTLSAYLLEKRGLSPTDRNTRTDAMRATVDRWLREKGVGDPSAPAGAFASETLNGGGTYKRERAGLGEDFVEDTTLEEKANAYQLFITRISIVSTADLVAVYATVSAVNTGSVIAPMPTSAKCPFVIRDIIRQSGDWSIGEAAIPSGKPQRFVGEDGGEAISKIIMARKRSFPLVVVSDLEGAQIWDALDKKAAFDLTGLAYVSSIDEDASWQLSERLGRRHACFAGAVRLYWPNPEGSSHEGFPSTVWTADRLLSVPTEADPEEQFRSLLRRRVMSVAALSITEPQEISAIRSAVSRKNLTDLEGQTTELVKIYEIATSYATDNDALIAQVAKLKGDLSYATTRAENAEALYQGLKEMNDIALLDAENDEPELDALRTEIQDGEVRFYKKIGSKGNTDRMVSVKDCGCNKWESGGKGDKAWRGVEHLEGRSDWKSIMHCASCTGGGVWRVKW